MLKILFLACVLCLRGTLCSGGSAYQHLGKVETLENGVVSLDVALEIGRIVSFKRHGEPDWVVAFDQETIPSWHWHPWGGDRVWPTAQHLNYQIYGNNGFDPVIDGQPWELVSKTKTSLIMRSGLSPQLGIQITHRIELPAKSAQVLHTYRVDRLESNPYPVHVWTITGVSEGDYILMESDASTPHPNHKPYRRWAELHSQPPTASLIPDSRILKFTWANDKTQKLGTYGNWIAMVRGREAFCQVIEFDPDALYLELSNLQAYMNRDRSTYEIEALSPTWTLRKGESEEWIVRWELVSLPESIQSDGAVAGFLSEQIE